MIHMSVCLCECVLENLCVFPNAQALTGKREHGETEGKEKEGGGWRALNVRQIDGPQQG